MTLHALVPAELDGARLDMAATRLFADYSRGRLQQWIEAGRVQVNAAIVVRVRHAVKAGDSLALDAELLPRADLTLPQAIALDVVYADADLAVVNKPPGLTVHPGAGQADGTLVNAILHRWPQTAALPRAGLVHRLDKDTSGLLVVALSAAAQTHLVTAMAKRLIRREYDALVIGTVRGSGTVDAPIGRDPHHRLRMAIVEDGRRAVTHYRVQRHYAHHSLLRVRLETGRTHQIRVHMTSIRHPIVGDPVYGGRPLPAARWPSALREALDAFRRQALHARWLAFTHPLNGEDLSFEAEPPADMQALLTVLENAEAPE